MSSHRSLIDVHVHLAGLPDRDNGCFISRRALGGPLFRMLFRRLGLPKDDPAQANRIYLRHLLDALEQAPCMDKAVVLAMDGVYGADGRLDQEQTEFLIGNDYLLAQVAAHPERLLAGVSINPMRRDALDELARCAEAGACLVKVLPNSQRFDPADARHRPFYQALAGRGLPLLTHVGYEFSLIGTDQSVGDLARWRLALDQGVTLIAAHGASQGLFFYEPHWRTLVEFVDRYPRCYWDSSALTLPNRAGMLLRLRRHPPLLERMLFGTDYPLPVFAFPALLAGRWRTLPGILSNPNPFERQYQILTTLGIRPSPGLPWRPAPMETA